MEFGELWQMGTVQVEDGSRDFRLGLRLQGETAVSRGHDFALSLVPKDRRAGESSAAGFKRQDQPGAGNDDLLAGIDLNLDFIIEIDDFSRHGRPAPFPNHRSVKSMVRGRRLVQGRWTPARIKGSW